MQGLGEVSWRCTMKASESQNTESKLYPLWNSQPMEYTKLKCLKSFCYSWAKPWCHTQISRNMWVHDLLTFDHSCVSYIQLTYRTAQLTILPTLTTVCLPLFSNHLWHILLLSFDTHNDLDLWPLDIKIHQSCCGESLSSLYVLSFLNNKLTRRIQTAAIIK